jgi:hypothetical protein
MSSWNFFCGTAIVAVSEFFFKRHFYVLKISVIFICLKIPSPKQASICTGITHIDRCACQTETRVSSELFLQI